MSNLAQWSLVVAFFVPLVVSVVTQSHWPAGLKSVVFFGLSLVAAAGTAYFQGDLTGRRFLDAALLIVAGGAAYYKGLFKPTGIAESVESATDVPTRTG